MINAKEPLVVVTGGASGIGLGLAYAFGKNGKKVFLADLNESALDSAVSELADVGILAIPHTVDLTDASAVADMFERSIGIGLLAGACLNAGVTSTGPPVWETPLDAFKFVNDVNVTGLLNSLRSVVPILIEQGAAADLVVTASMAGMVASGGSGAYSASKAAAIALTKALRAELAEAAPYIRVCLLNPGMVKTNLMRNSVQRLPSDSGLTPEFAEAAHQALNQYGSAPSSVAQSVLDALEGGRFWVLPPLGDPFAGALAAELDELRKALRP